MGGGIEAAGGIEAGEGIKAGERVFLCWNAALVCVADEDAPPTYFMP